jgi:hypothetical protein
MNTRKNKYLTDIMKKISLNVDFIVFTQIHRMFLFLYGV